MLQISVQYNEPNNFAPEHSFVVDDPADLAIMPRGSFVAFVGDVLAGANQRVLAHAMVSLGNGRVVGSNNGPIGGSSSRQIMELNSFVWDNG